MTEHIEISFALLSALARTAQDNSGWSGDEARLKPRTDQVLGEGGLLKFYLRDYFWLHDRRLLDFPTDDLFDALAPGMGWQTVPVCRRPKARDTRVSMFTALPLADVASYAIFLERIGFNVDPSHLVSAVIARLSRGAFISRAELDCLWHRRERFRMEPVKFVAPLDVGRFDVGQNVSRNGVIATWGRTADGGSVEISFYPPERKNRAA